RPVVEQRKTNNLSFNGAGTRPISSKLETPAFFSGYVNAVGQLDYFWDAPRSVLRPTFGEPLSNRLELEATARIGGVVLENIGLYRSSDVFVTCYQSLRCNSYDAHDFMRQSSRVVFDLPQSSTRLQVGDVALPAARSLAAPEILGISIEKSPMKLNPLD